MYRAKAVSQCEVIEIDTIERGVHLIPYFKIEYQTAIATPTSRPALDMYDEFWVNNQIDLHMYNTIY